MQHGIGWFPIAVVTAPGWVKVRDTEGPSVWETAQHTRECPSSGANGAPLRDTKKGPAGLAHVGKRS